jgi:homoserine kinase
MGNVGIGFDILGLAFDEPGDIVQVRLRETPGAVVVAIEGDGGVLPTDPKKNTAAVAAQALLDTIGAQQGVEITLHKRLPLASGLGSSAASAVAAAVAVNALFGSPLAKQDLLPACLEGEACVSGYHADNVAPSLLGGIVLIVGRQIHRLPVPAGLWLALVTPDVAVPTSAARAVLPQFVSLAQMTAQTAGVALLVDALHRGDIAQIAAAMESDGVVEPARAHLMPRMYEARAAAKGAGALAVVISGAGPTLCAVCDTADGARLAAAAMKAEYDAAGLSSAARHCQVGTEGARVLCVQ